MMITKFLILATLVIYTLGEGIILRGGCDNEEYRKSRKCSTLIQTHIVMSPGERTPKDVSAYPTDPHINETYFPFGQGELTLKGRTDAYKLGEQLYKRYKDFIGRVYSPEYFESFSAMYFWSQVSLQGVHAALFPPTEHYRISNNLNWQAIPYSYSKLQDDSMLAPYRACELQFWLTDDLEKSEYKEKLKEFQPLFQYLSEHTGLRINNTRVTELLYSRLAAQLRWGLDLPDWATKVYPHTLERVTNWMWKIMANTPAIQRLASGALLQKITKDSEARILGSNSKRMYLYATVDFTFVPLMGALGNHNGASYNTNSYLLFEMHKINEVYGIKTYLNDRTNEETQLIRIRGCDEFCPLSQFREILEDRFPLKNWCSV